MAEVKVMVDKVKETKPKEEKPKEEKPAVPETVALKEIAKKIGIEPREARSILRKLNIRAEGEKRSRWQFPPNQVDSVVSRIKAFKAEREKAKAEKATAAGAEEEKE